MTIRRLGIRGRINLALGAVICLATVTFGVGYALHEGGALLEAKREHLQHLAVLAQARVSAATGPDELEQILEELDRGLFEATKVDHEISVTSATGAVLAASSRTELGASGGRALGNDAARASLLLPTSIEVVTPLRFVQYSAAEARRQPAVLKLAEPLDELRQQVFASLFRHFLFAGGLIGVTMLFVGAIVHRVVVRPVRDLAAATEGIAVEGHWDPIYPSMRRGDEIGVLGDRIATMSRRLADAVRSERYASAHLVATRVRRELDEPVRRVRIELEILKEIGAGPDEARACDEIGAAIDEISEIGRRLREIRSIPPA